MKRDYDNVKFKVTLILAFMIFLFTFCSVAYSDAFRKKEMNINTNIELSGGNDVISRRLQEIIPYTEVIENQYKMAYQDRITNYLDIDNDIYLYMGLKNTNNIDAKKVAEDLKTNYGDNLFLINKNINIDGKKDCKYINNSKEYICTNLENENNLYTAFRSIDNISINGDYYYLTENIVFYKIIKSEEAIKYEIYTDYKYSNLYASFTSLDLAKENIGYEEYINRFYMKNPNIYRTKFKINDDNYRWISTERLS